MSAPAAVRRTAGPDTGPDTGTAPATLQGNGSRIGLYRDAAALAASSVLTAGLGLVFWAVVARTVPPQRLGVQTAVLSVLTAPAVVVGSGVGDALTALLPAAGADRAALVRRAYRWVLVLAAAAGAVAGTVAVLALPALRGNGSAAVAIGAGTLVWALFTVQDAALTALRRSHWLPVENGLVSLAKVALVPALVAAGAGAPVVVATLVPAALAVAVLAPAVHRTARTAGTAAGSPASGTAEHGAGTATAFAPLARRTTAGVALTLGSLTLLPFVVTAVAGPAQGAVFALCLALVSGLDFAGAALGVSVVVHAAARPDDAAHLARAAFARAAAVVGAGGVVLVAVAPALLRLLGPSYVSLHGVAVVTVLAASSLARTGFVVWAGLQRARRRLGPVLRLNAVAACCLFAALLPAAHRWGAVGAAGALAAAQTVLALGAALDVLRHRGAGEGRA